MYTLKEKQDVSASFPLSSLISNLLPLNELSVSEKRKHSRTLDPLCFLSPVRLVYLPFQIPKSKALIILALNFVSPICNFLIYF